MRRHLIALVTSTLVLAGIAGDASAEIKGQLVSSKVIWDRARINRDTDILRYHDRWFVVCCEKTGEFSTDAALRVISSVDGDTWESAALLPGPIPKLSYRYDPAFSVTDDGQLMLSSHGTRTKTWFSRDGRTWSEPTRIGPKDQDLAFSRIAWHNGIGLSYAHGDSCGNASTIQFFSSRDGKSFQSIAEETVGGIPDDAQVIFDGDRAYCLMTRQSPDIDRLTGPREFGRPFEAALLGTATPPYTTWDWKTIAASISVPNLLRLPDRRIIAAVGLAEKRDSITLGEFNLATGKLTEFLDLPVPIEDLVQAAYHRQIVGLTHHDGHVWVSYHATHAGKLSIHLAKVTLTPAKPE